MNFDMNKEQLRQSLLELHYDLLDEGQANELRAAIATEPKVAAEWAATLAWSGKLADASKFEGAIIPEIKLSAGLTQAPPSSNGSASPEDHPIVAQLVEQVSNQNVQARNSEATEATLVEPRRETGNRAVSRAGARRWWIRPTALAATAAAIGMLVISSLYFDSVPSAPTPVVRVVAQPVASETSQSDNEFHFVTTRMDSSSSARAFPVTPATLSFSVLARNAVLFSGTARTDVDGAGKITLPSELVIPQDAKLHVTARAADAALSHSSIEVPLEPTRCLTYLTVDRPVYRPGETVFFRSLTLQRRSLRVNSDVPIRFELVDPSGAVVPGAFSEGVTDRGVGNGSFVIPSTAPGGPYSLVAKSLDEFFPEERCEFQVRAYRVPRFKKEIELRQRSYGPGETVEADFSAIRAEGGPLAGAAVGITVTVDDEVIHQETTTTTASGTCLISFTLPTMISNGVGQLSVVIDDGGTRETKSKTIPIQLGRVSVDFYPEGGYLVDGLKNRVYFAARDSLGKPIHVAGEILNRSGQSVAEIETKRDGMGRFDFVPRRGERYTLKVSEPIDVSNSPRLPAVVKDLPVIDTGAGVFDSRGPITMVVRSTKAIKTLVRAVCRGQLIGQQEVSLHAGENSLSLPIREGIGGVVRVTIFDVGRLGQGREQTGVAAALPLVERLVFRRTEKQLRVEIVDEESVLQRSPGEPLRLTLQVRDETGEPAPAVLGVSVVDDAALSLQETERPQLRTHFLLTSEVEKPEDLEHANFYLSDDPEAAESLDLLLGTQGWRRFISGSSSQPEASFREQLIRLIELDGSEVAAVPRRFDNLAGVAQPWLEYRDAVRFAWQRLLEQTRMLLFVILFLWLLAILFHMRRHAQWNVAGWLLVASASLFIYGCGGGQEAMVVESSALAPKQAQIPSSENYQADMEFMVDAPTDGAIDVAPDSAASEQGKSQEAADEAIQSGSSAVPATNEQSRPGGWADDLVALREAWHLSSSSASPPRSISKQDLERLLAARGLDAEALAEQLLDELRFPVREYAHRHTVNDSEVRHDFAETLYWQPMLITDSEGRASVRFDLSDSVTTFRVSVDGHSMDGRIGSGGGNVVSRLPFQIEPKMPLEVTMGDRIDLPIAVINATDEDTEVQVSLTADAALQPVGDTTRVVTLEAGQRRREHISLEVTSGSAESDAAVQIRGVGTNSLADSIRRSIHISPAGYPTRESIAGRLSERAMVRLPIPKDRVPGSLAVTVRAYPSPIADVMSGVESILREPHGCFEQTSATNYPNAMALLYLKESQTANLEVSRRAMGMLDRGYQKLISFECDKLGYEWFGDDPGHEALSAFGLMQFTDMSQVMEVSEEMITRTRTWLLGRRDGRGGFHRNSRHLHVWSVQQPIVNAYVLWAISEADVAAGQPHRTANELSSELDALHRVAQDSTDPYLVALSAATLMNVQRRVEGEALLDQLAEMQKADGSLQGATTVTSSGGLSLKMETTALATLAWVKSPRFIPRAQAAAEWISSNRLGNAGFGSTQATVLALKALVAMSGKTQTGGGTLQVQLDGNVIGSVKLPDEPQSGSTVEIQGLGAKLDVLDDKGNVEIELVGRGARNLSYTIDVACHVPTPKSDENCPLDLSTRMTGALDGDGKIDSGQMLKVEARMSNTSDQGQPMSVAIVGLPGGVEPRVDELDELQEAGRFDYYEIRGREVVFYWRTVEPRGLREVDFHVTATVPGKYTGPASRVYLYYTAEQKQWIEPLEVEINR